MVVAPGRAGDAARAGLAARERVRGGGTHATVDLAVKLVDGHDLEPADIALMAHPPDGTIAAALCGGPEGRRWAAHQLEARVAAVTNTVDVRRRRLERLSSQLARIDAELRAALLAAADHALSRALEHAGVKVGSRIAQRRAKGEAKQVDEPAIAAALDQHQYTPTVLAAVGVEEHELLDHAFDAFRDVADRHISLAQRRRRHVLARYARRPDSNFDDWEPAEKEHRDTAVALLAGGMLALARERLARPDVQFPDVGEVPAIPTIPPALIRDTVRASNGAAALVDPSLSGPGVAVLTVPGTVLDDEPNPLVRQAIEALEPGAVRQLTWSHGDPARPFEPHALLDGATFDWARGEQFDLGPLAKDPGEWPYGTAYWFPQDHEFCTCSLSDQWGVDADIGLGDGGGEPA